MDRDEFSDLVKDVVGDLLETHLASVHEEVSDLRSDLNTVHNEVADGFRSVRTEMRDSFVGLKNEIGGMHNRVDNQTFGRKDLEHRIRKVLPNLPGAAQ